MDQEEADWIKNNVTEVQEEEESDFEGELFLSTDGKNTVHVKANNKKARRQALVWAKAVYDKLLYSYGTKQAQAVKEYSKNGNGHSEAEKAGCSHAQTEVRVTQSGKNAGKSYKRCVGCNSFVGWV